MLAEQQHDFVGELDLENESEEGKDHEVVSPPIAVMKEQEEDIRKLVHSLLKERLGDKAWVVVRYLGRPGPRRNTMPVVSTARTSLR